MWFMMSKMPATIWYFGRLYVNSGFMMANFGATSVLNTWPIFRFCSWFVMTEPPFISDPVPAMVSVISW